MTAAETKNKLVRSITEEQLSAFLGELVASPGVDGPMIKEKALEKFGVSIGNDSANQFRKEVFGKYVEKLRRAAQMSKTVAEHRKDGQVNTLADASSDLLQQALFEFMVESDLDFNNPKDVEKAEAISRMIKAARSEDRRMIEQLDKRVKELEDQHREAEKALQAASGKQGGISDDTIKAVRQALGMSTEA